MKHSFDYSFVNSANTTMAQHSFYQPSATLAAHSIYNFRPFFNGPTGHAFQDAQPTPYLLQDPQALSSDFQSNSWYIPGAGPLADPRNNCRSTYLGRPLLGLGISFDSAEDSNFAFQNQHSRLSTPPKCTAEGVPNREYPSDVEMATNDSLRGAYSQCPGEEFIAPTRRIQPALTVSDSLTEEFLMLIDSSPTFLESKMDIDSPVRSSEESMFRASYLSQMLVSPDASTVGIIPDVNFRTIAAQRNAPVLCVNPADLSGPGPVFSPSPPLFKVEDEDIMITKTAPLNYSVTTSPRTETTSTLPKEVVSTTDSVSQETVKRPEVQERLVAASDVLPVMQYRQYAITPQMSAQMSVQLPTFPTRSLVTQTASRPIPVIEVSAGSTARTPLGVFDLNDPLYDSSLATFSELSPILNVHEGVELHDVRRKAEAWRKLNPGFDLDKAFLQVFAGKLSEEGDEISTFRCYVKGCSQTNKRRDHILVHVGSHVEHRPFKCDTCDMRFLRKNECKRHMASHAGFKPYSCSICPAFMKKNFVRQDLLKRHLKVTHGFTSTAAAASGRRRVWKRSDSLSPDLQ